MVQAFGRRDKMWKTVFMIHRLVDRMRLSFIFAPGGQDSCRTTMHRLHNFHACHLHTSPKDDAKRAQIPFFHNVHRVWITWLWIAANVSVKRLSGFLGKVIPRISTTAVGGPKMESSMHNMHTRPPGADQRPPAMPQLSRTISEHSLIWVKEYTVPPLMLLTSSSTALLP